MRANSVVEEVLRGGVFLIVACAIGLAGWNEPLRYLFMKTEEISALEHAEFAPVASARQSPFGWQPQGTALDRAPYRSYEGGYLEYTNNFDRREMGTPTETGRRKGSRGPAR